MILIIICLLFVFCHADVTHDAAGTRINVLGQSGKVRITRVDKVITMQVDYLHEVDASGNTVGQTGSSKHSVNSFATQAFTFTPLKELSYQNVSMQEFTFATDVHSIGKLKIVTMMVEEASSVATETETWSVARGDIKWNIELSDWAFCDPCSDGTAAYIDIGIEIKSTKSEKKNNTIDLGDATLQLSNRVQVDGTEQNMPSGYPKIVSQGSKELFIFRFPTFSQKVVYDPLLQLSATSPAAMPRYQQWLLLTFFCLYCLA